MTNIKNHEFNGIQVRQAVEKMTFSKGFKVPKGYVCLTDITKAAPHFRVSKYLTKDSVKTYLAKLSQMLGIPEKELIKRNTKLGVWVHEFVMLKVASELDPEIEIWALQTFRLTGQGRLIPADNKDAEAVKTVEKVQEKYQKLQQEYELLYESNEANANNSMEFTYFINDFINHYADVYEFLRAVLIGAIPVETALKQFLYRRLILSPKQLFTFLRKDRDMWNVPHEIKEYPTLEEMDHYHDDESFQSSDRMFELICDLTDSKEYFLALGKVGSADQSRFYHRYIINFGKTPY